MTSRWDRIRNGEPFKFKGGIFPAENKLTADSPIETIAPPGRLVLPLRQHAGPPGEILVRPGRRVLRNEPLTASDDLRRVAVHAPLSGTVESVGPAPVPHPSGFPEPCVVIRCDPPDSPGYGETYENPAYPGYEDEDPALLLRHISAMGVAGLGGAGFPTAAKLGGPVRAGGCRLLIVNGAECEPYITCDDRVMRERAALIAEGVRVLRAVLKPDFTVAAIESNKPEAIRAVSAAFAAAGIPDARVTVIPVKYPSGAARNLIALITGIEIPYSARSAAYGVVVLNVSTVCAAADAVVRGQPLTRRVVTVAGTALAKRGNFDLPIGCGVPHILDCLGYRAPATPRVIVGGPMMGFTLRDADVPVIKTTGCLIAPGEDEIKRVKPQVSCIRCGRCAKACPSRLIPYELYAYCAAGQYEDARKRGLGSCIECGCCSWVCPSAIRLIAEFRAAKAQLRIERMKREKLQTARIRFEEKQRRLAEEERLRAERKAAALAKIRSRGAAPAAAAPAQAQTTPAQAPAAPAAAADRNARAEERKRLALEKARALREARLGRTTPAPAAQAAQAAQAPEAPAQAPATPAPAVPAQAQATPAPAAQAQATPAPAAPAAAADRDARAEERKRIALEKARALRAARLKKQSGENGGEKEK